jgi:hypothetical protein
MTPPRFFFGGGRITFSRIWGRDGRQLLRRLKHACAYRTAYHLASVSLAPLFRCRADTGQDCGLERYGKFILEKVRAIERSLGPVSK